MTIGRLNVGIIKPGMDWGYERGSCGCMIVSLGKIYITWIDKDCKCTMCKKYYCECKDEK